MGVDAAVEVEVELPVLIARVRRGRVVEAVGRIQQFGLVVATCMTIVTISGGSDTGSMERNDITAIGIIADDGQCRRAADFSELRAG